MTLSGTSYASASWRSGLSPAGDRGASVAVFGSVGEARGEHPRAASEGPSVQAASYSAAVPVPRRKLLLSIHDASPRFHDEVARLAGHLDELVGPGRYAMLVVPDHWGEAPLLSAPAFRRDLRRWAELGVEMFVHGFHHQDDRVHAGFRNRWRARLMTAGEGEFLGLDETGAAQRIALGRAIVEEVTGRPAAGFVAPAWLYGEGAHRALARSSLPLAEDHLRVWRPADGRVLARGPVVTWATRTRAREVSSLIWAAVARAAYRPLGVARVGVHPGDLHSAPVMASITATIRALARGRQVARYADLLDPGDPGQRG